MRLRCPFWKHGWQIRASSSSSHICWRFNGGLENLFGRQRASKFSVCLKTRLPLILGVMKTCLFACRLAALLAVPELSAVSLSAHPAAADMAAAADQFLASLSPDQRAKAAFDFKADERLDWHYIPKDRKGLPLKEMSSEQRSLAHALLRSGLSQRGYSKATNIM